MAMPMAMASDIDVSFIRLNHYASMSLPLACFLCIVIYSTPGTSASSETVHEYDVIRHNNGIKDKVKDNDDVTSQKLILILSDGLRWDYFRQNMTGFQRMFSTGVKAEHMIPSFPALSYTNYYSIATGKHGSCRRGRGEGGGGRGEGGGGRGEGGGGGGGWGGGVGGGSIVTQVSRYVSHRDFWCRATPGMA